MTKRVAYLLSQSKTLPFILLLFFLSPSTVVAANDQEPLIFATFGDHAPYHSVGKSGKLKGFDVSLAHLLQRKMNRPIEVQIIPEDRIIDYVINSKVDAIIGITESDEGKKIFDYSRPYLYHKTRLFVHEGTTFIKTVTDLKNLQVGVVAGADVENFLKMVPGINLIPQKNAVEGLANLSKHVITVYMGDEYESDNVIQENQLKGITTVGGTFLLRKRTIAVKKGNSELLNNINSALEVLQNEYKLQELRDTWLSRRIAWAGDNRRFLTLLLVALIIVATSLMIAVVWNHRLTKAVEDRTRDVQLEHEQFENIFEHASDGIVILNPETSEVEQANQAFEEILGYTPEELAEIPLSHLDATEEKNFANQIHRALVSGENVLFESRLYNKSQEMVDLFIHAKAFPYKGKRMVEAIARDITKIKKIEAMKDTILQDVAHELKTPMAKLSMSIDLLERKLDPEAKEKHNKQFDICHRAMIRLQNTIEGILNLSRMESHAAELHMEDFFIENIIKGVIHELRMFADRKGIQIQEEFSTNETLVRGDTEMMRRLFVNLIHNAIKFTDAGSVLVSSETDDEFIKISVKDNGIGLEKDELTKIFGRFYQKSAAIEGSGVGLTIAQKIVSYHNGVIWAESPGLGKGATMLVLFPIAKTK